MKAWQSKNSRALVCTLSAGAIFAACSAIYYFQIQRCSKEDVRSSRGRARASGRQILAAVHMYTVRHGQMPYDSRGGDHALYKVVPYVDYRHFSIRLDCEDYIGVVDHIQERITECPWNYINEKTLNIPLNQIVLQTEKENTVICVRGDGRVFVCGPVFLVKCKLGDWVTEDGFAFVDHEAFKDWRITHSFDKKVISRSTTEVILSNSITFAYKYADGRLERCEIRSYRSDVVIVEEVVTDADGRIYAIHRTPSDWQHLWNEWQ